MGSVYDMCYILVNNSVVNNVITECLIIPVSGVLGKKGGGIIGSIGAVVPDIAAVRKSYPHIPVMEHLQHIVDLICEISSTKFLDEVRLILCLYLIPVDVFIGKIRIVLVKSGPYLIKK